MTPKNKLTNLSIIGDRDIWIQFVNIAKLERKTVWDILEPLITKYILDYNNKK